MMPPPKGTVAPDRWRAKLNKAARVLKEDGFKSFWIKLLDATVYRRVIVMVRDFDYEAPELADDSSIRTGLLTIPEIPEYLVYRPDADSTEIRRRLLEGDSCLVLRHRRRMIRSIWLSTRRAWIDYLGGALKLAPGEVYTYDVFTDPRYRGRQISILDRPVGRAHLRKIGCRRMVSVVVPENRASLRKTAKLNWRHVGWMGCIRLGPLRYAFQRMNKGVQRRTA